MFFDSKKKGSAMNRQIIYRAIPVLITLVAFFVIYYNTTKEVDMTVGTMWVGSLFVYTLSVLYAWCWIRNGELQVATQKVIEACAKTIAIDFITCLCAVAAVTALYYETIAGFGAFILIAVIAVLLIDRLDRQSSKSRVLKRAAYQFVATCIPIGWWMAYQSTAI